MKHVPCQGTIFFNPLKSIGISKLRRSVFDYQIRKKFIFLRDTVENFNNE